MLIYLAGPYRAKHGRSVIDNIRAARAVAEQLWREGYVVICPHLNTAHMEHAAIPDDYFLQGDLEIVERCDAVVMLPHWEQSEGSISEREYATKRGIPVVEWPARPARNRLALWLDRVKDALQRDDSVDWPELSEA